MNKPQLFDFKGQSVRTVTINDEAYFVGKDVAKILRYSNTQRSVNAHVDSEDKRGVPNQYPLRYTRNDSH